MLQTAAAIHDPVRMRQAGADLLSLALIDARNHTLRWLSAFEPHLAALETNADVDPPLWLVGHAAWFQEYWVARNLQRQRGEALDATRLTLTPRITVAVTTVPITAVTVARRAIALGLIPGSLIAVAVGAAVVPLPALGTLVANRTLGLVVALVGEVAVLAAIAVLAVELVLVAVELVALAALLRILFLEARARLGQHAEIVIGELQVIFGVHPVARHLRVASEILVFLKQLRGIATCAIVDAVARIGVVAAALLALATTAATATVVRLTIVDQRLCVLYLLNTPSVKQRSRLRVTPHAVTIHRTETAPAWLPDNQQRACLDLGRQTFSTI